jgi:wyosine [tRNA(Phe)-imidazoG37] synthetase (radical SAM superfamily)
MAVHGLMVKIDAGTERTFQVINDPDPGISLRR